MKINVPKFRNLIKKSTLNYSMECLQLNFDPKEVKSSMISGPRDVLTNICLDNDFVTGMGIEDQITLNFIDPAGKVSRYLDILPEEVDVTIEENVKFTLHVGRRTIDIFMVDDSIIRNHISQKSAKEMSYFITLPVDQAFKTIVDGHKTVAPYYQKIYFGVKNKDFFIQSTDRTNSGINTLNDPICPCDTEDMVMCFEFRNFFNLMEIIDDAKAAGKEFDLNFTYSKSDDRGLIYAVSKDGKEKYFLISRAL